MPVIIYIRTRTGLLRRHTETPKPHTEHTHGLPPNLDGEHTRHVPNLDGEHLQAATHRTVYRLHTQSRPVFGAFGALLVCRHTEPATRLPEHTHKHHTHRPPHSHTETGHALITETHTETQRQCQQNKSQVALIGLAR